MIISLASGCGLTMALASGENLRIAVPPPPAQRPEDFGARAPEPRVKWQAFIFLQKLDSGCVQRNSLGVTIHTFRPACGDKPLSHCGGICHLFEQIAGCLSDKEQKGNHESGAQMGFVS